MKSLLLVIVLSLIPQSARELALPGPVGDRFLAEDVWSKFKLTARINPFYLRADFDGDGKPDYVVLVTRLDETQEADVFVLSTQKKLLIVPGEGHDFDAWEIIERGTVIPSTGRRLRFDGLVEKSGGPGSVSVWNGKAFDVYLWGE